MGGVSKSAHFSADLTNEKLRRGTFFIHLGLHLPIFFSFLLMANCRTSRVNEGVSYANVIHSKVRSGA